MSCETDTIYRYLEKLQEYTAELRNYQNLTYEQFVADIEKQWAVCYGLQISVRGCCYV